MKKWIWIWTVVTVCLVALADDANAQILRRRRPTPPTVSTEVTIDTPQSGSSFSSRLITVSGTSTLPEGTRLEVWVVTDRPYRQDNDGIVGSNGKWSSSGVVLGGRSHSI